MKSVTAAGTIDVRKEVFVVHEKIAETIMRATKKAAGVDGMSKPQQKLARNRSQFAWQLNGYSRSDMEATAYFYMSFEKNNEITVTVEGRRPDWGENRASILNTTYDGDIDVGQIVNRVEHVFG